MFFKFCNGGDATEEAVKQTSIMEFEHEEDANHDIIELLMQQDNERSKISGFMDSASASINHSAASLVSDIQVSSTTAQEVVFTATCIDWDMEIKTFSDNMKGIGKENAKVQQIVGEKKRSRKKKSLRNNQKRRQQHQVLQARQLQLSASV